MLTDFAAYPEWNPFMFSVEGAAEAGAHLQIAMQRRGGMVLRFGARVVVSDPPRELAWSGEGLKGHLPGLVRGERRVVIDPLANDRSRLRMRTTFSGLLAPLMGWLERYREAFAEMELALKVRAEEGAYPRSARKQHALELFEELPRRYDELGAALSFFQDPRWRRAMVATVGARPTSASSTSPTGTGLVAQELVRSATGAASSGSTRAPRCSSGRGASSRPIRRSPTGSSWSTARPSRCRSTTESSTTSPSPTCCATSTTPRRRWASWPGWSGRAGAIACLEFCVPRGAWLWPWRLYTRVGLPALGRLAGRQWYEVGRFLGPSIEGFYARHPLERQLEMWRRSRHRERHRAADEPRRRASSIWGTPR